ncbi:MAG TPA: hypothetical protein VEK76_04030 [Candidatus Binatia bacterium]|nr:hypothetical protein [Candidatus Binatia bacterium]
MNQGYPAPPAAETATWGDPDCVVIDVGVDAGALVVSAEERFEGREVEISARGDPGWRAHAALRARRLARRTLVAACFASLPPGDYLIWPPATGSPVAVTVTAGEVASVALAPPPSDPTNTRRR